MTAASTAITDRPKAYSYVRFSTPEQAKGRSYERQIERAQAYAKAHGLELAEASFDDLGVSAFHGKNAETGALQRFLRAVQDGDIPGGSYLLVESLDRITRNAILDAQALFIQIISAGITLVTLMDGRSYTRESINASPIELIHSLLIMMRAHEESATKSRRLADAYERKRKDAADGKRTKVFTRMLPGWLQYDEKKHVLVAVPERAEVVRSIFTKAEEGWGQHRIAQWLNERHTPTWGGHGKQRKAEHWHRSYVKKLLANPAVVGTFTPHQRTTDARGRRVRKPLEPIEGYFPAVIDRETFERVANRAQAVAPRGRNTTTEPASIFAGVVRCAYCGSVMTRVSKGDYVYIVCSRAHRKAGGCKYQAVTYRDVENAFRRNARAIIRNAPRGMETEELDAKIANLDEVVSIIADEARTLADELIREKSAVLRTRLREKESELETAKEDLRELRTRRDALTAPFVQRRLRTLQDALKHKPFNVSTVNRALKEAVSKIVLNPETGRLAIHWHHAPEPTDGVPFVSKHSRAFDEATRG